MQLAHSLLTFLFSLLINFSIVNMPQISIGSIHTGPQQFHKGFVPRLGGIGIFIATLINVVYFPILLKLVISGLPSFLGGLSEDLTARLSPKVRLVLSFLSGLIFFLLFRADILNFMQSIGGNVLLLLVLVFVGLIFISGVINAVNIIDGFNGLAGFYCVFVLLSMALVAHNIGELSIASISLLICSAVLGFLVLNFPGGKIFLGDGGAYFLGFIISAISIILVLTSKVSILYPIAVLIYPIFETLFSIYRKAFLRGRSPVKPDGLHLHMLVYKHFLKKRIRVDYDNRNPMAGAVIVITVFLTSILPATFLYANTFLLTFVICAFMALYIIVYWHILMPNLLKRLRERS